METLKILFLASHWRVSLIKAFQQAKSSQSMELICVDSDPLAPSFKEADCSQIIPPFSNSQCLPSLLEFCETKKISAMIPLTNRAIEFMAYHRQELGGGDRRLWIPENSVIEICHDKWKLYEFLEREGFNTPKTFLAENKTTSFPFPLIAKPRRGEGSKNLFILENYGDWDFYKKKCPQHVFQKRIDGQEFSVDCLFDQQGLPRLIVPRERLAVRGGEVMTSQINLDAGIMDTVEALGSKLGLTGPCTIQGLQGDDGKFYFTDVNLRFGSGYVHTISAGGDAPQIIFKELAGQELNSNRPTIKNNSVMTRFPENIFHSD
ncbi:MAG: ATP-grasp domain-containing protein [Nitrospina sp.]|jgi:carbamoyl-phosphate synthase large subunit|nr:ATP-grasp domain-containing protein [Nitrospina sp.]MBT3508315.1 ATP-grasp domain-containing protein [Nitrospina sp.]MBT3874743.1 ATP-grasp domain-containing protein [Nitrospina sp.]MBT4049477.1 ATP-grasp domain-containing protein [Nitrospina sp.]MBT4558411.1 ATP-grasp domain-containing protein [Nitrospina sp.]